MLSPHPPPSSYAITSYMKCEACYICLILWCMQGAPEDPSKSVIEGSNDASVNLDVDVCLPLCSQWF